MSTSAPPTTFAVDGLTPSSIIEPSSIDELAAALAAANEQGAAVIPWGGGCHMALGNIPARYDLALRTTKLDRVIEYEPADLTITVEAGITFGLLQLLLAEHGQFLPIDAPADATVGGVLAANVSGPSRHAYGLPRDWLIGCRVAHAGGTISQGGGRVVKNVAGYDMPKLYVGSLGTLGVIVEATFKLAPVPAAQETLVVECSSIEAAADLIFAADDRNLALRAVALLRSDDAITRAAFWLGGPQAAVERTARELGELSKGCQTERLIGDASERRWAIIGAGLDPPSVSATENAILRVSLPPSAVAGFCENARDLCAFVAYPTTGLVLLSLHPGALPLPGVTPLPRERGRGAGGEGAPPAPSEQQPATIAALRRAARDAGGSLVVTQAPVEVKQQIDVWGEVEALPVMRRVKEQFDPRGTLNPGRYIGVL